jgi:flagellar FliL protein
MSSRVVVSLLVLNILLIIGGTAVNFFWKGSVAEFLAIGAEQGDRPERRSAVDLADFQFLNVEKIYVNLRGNQREHYLVIDLAVQASAKIDKKELQQFAPVVRNSVVARLSGMRYEVVRSLSIAELQLLLEEALRQDVFERNLRVSFEHLLVNKLLAQ